MNPMNLQYLKSIRIIPVILTILLSSYTTFSFAGLGKISLISQTKGQSAQTDIIIQKHLENLGYQVDLLDQDQDPKKISKTDLIILSSTVSSKSLKEGWRYIPIPLLTWENDYLDDLAMTGKRSGTDFGEIEKDRYLWMVNAPHALSAQLASGVLNVYQAQAPMSWGKPGLGATIIATIYGQPEKPAIWAYEKGATMDYESIAPARRMMFFLNNDTFSNLNANGIRLFDEAVKWMVQKHD